MLKVDILQIDKLSGQAIKVMEEAGLEPETCEKFLLVHSRILHGQHAHMLDVKHSLLHLLGHHEGFLMADLSDKQLQYKEEIARTILGVADKILPGKLHLYKNSPILSSCRTLNSRFLLNFLNFFNTLLLCNTENIIDMLNSFFEIRIEFNITLTDTVRMQRSNFIYFVNEICSGFKR